MSDFKDYGVIIAARTDSHRLYGKVLLPLKGIPLITFLIRRIRKSEIITQIILATTTLPEDDELVNIALSERINVFRGEKNNVVKRFVDAAAAYNWDYVVRVTGDCPFVNGASLDYCLMQCKQINWFDLATTKGNFPVGIDYEIYKTETLEMLNSETLTSDEREHLTLPIYNRSDRFHIVQLMPPDTWTRAYSSFTVDTEADYHFAKTLAEPQTDIHFDIPTLLHSASSISQTQ